MSQENVDAQVAAIAAANRRDMPAILAGFDPNVCFEPGRAAIQGPYLGREAIRAYYKDTWEAFETFEFSLDSCRGIDDRVVSVGNLRIRMENGLVTEVPFAAVATFRDGLITHLKDYREKEKALKAVGLSE
jgi:ketosteroid isomerase-like protein